MPADEVIDRAVLPHRASPELASPKHAQKPAPLNLIGKLNQRVFLPGTAAALSSSYRSLKLEVIHER
jgi:hypothetical protein